MTWEELLGREDILGGELQIDKDSEGVTYRGPIWGFSVYGGTCIFRLLWVAKIESCGNGKWTFWRSDFAFPVILKEEELSGPNSGMISFNLSLIERGIIFLKGINLDPDTIEGLPPEYH